jgi:hypothetical protein
MVFAFFLLDDIDYDFLKIKIIPGFLAACFAAPVNSAGLARQPAGLSNKSNERLDAEFDQFHPVKKNRPVIAAKLRGKYIA